MSCADSRNGVELQMNWQAGQCSVARMAVLMGAEGLVIFCSVALCLMLRQAVAHSIVLTPSVVLIAVLVTMIIQACLFYYGLYDPSISLGLAAQLVPMVQAVVIAVAVLLLAGLSVPGIFDNLQSILPGVAAVLLALPLWRFVFRKLAARGVFDHKVILFGTGGRAGAIYAAAHHGRNQASAKGGEADVKVVAVADLDHPRCPFALQSATPFLKLNSCRELVELASQCKTRKVVVCSYKQDLPAADLYFCKHSGLQFGEAERLYELIVGQVDTQRLDPPALIFSPNFQRSCRRFYKRAGDIAVALGLLVALSPLLAALILLYKLDSQKKALLAESMVGMRKKTFMRYRFSPAGLQTPIRPRFSVGRLVRRWRLEALPQLWNVLKGDMSLVGPCPIGPRQALAISNDLALFDERFTVRPGLTGWAQVNCGGDGSDHAWKQMFGFDLYYLKYMSLGLDIAVLCRTMKDRKLGLSLAGNVA